MHWSKKRFAATCLFWHCLLLFFCELADLVRRLGKNRLRDDLYYLRHGVEVIHNLWTSGILYCFNGSPDPQPEYFRILSRVSQSSMVKNKSMLKISKMIKSISLYMER